METVKNTQNQNPTQSSSQLLGGVYIVNHEKSNKNMAIIVLAGIIMISVIGLFGYTIFIGNKPQTSQQIIQPTVSQILPTKAQPSIVPTNSPSPTAPNVEDNIETIQTEFDNITVDDYVSVFEELNDSLSGL